jgi:hypothetical protein
MICPVAAVCPRAGETCMSRMKARRSKSAKPDLFLQFIANLQGKLSHPSRLHRDELRK